MIPQNSPTPSGRDQKAKNAYDLEYYYANRESILDQRRQKRRSGKVVEKKRNYADRKAVMNVSERALCAKYHWRVMVQAACKRARKRGLPCDLTYDWARAVWTGKCEVTGVEFQRGSKISPFSASIDRVDPSLGYIQSNCRFVLLAVNMLKGVGSDEEMFRVAAAIVASRS